MDFIVNDFLIKWNQIYFITVFVLFIYKFEWFTELMLFFHTLLVGYFRGLLSTDTIIRSKFATPSKYKLCNYAQYKA